MATVINRGDQRRCDHGADARQLREPPTSFIRPAKPRELLIQLVEPEIESPEFVEQVAEELAREVGKLSACDRVGRLRKKAPRSLG